MKRPRNALRENPRFYKILPTLALWVRAGQAGPDARSTACPSPRQAGPSCLSLPAALFHLLPFFTRLLWEGVAVSQPSYHNAELCLPCTTPAEWSTADIKPGLRDGSWMEPSPGCSRLPTGDDSGAPPKARGLAFLPFRAGPDSTVTRLVG